MSPLPEACRLMFSEGFYAASASYSVGYGNAAQFSQPYNVL